MKIAILDKDIIKVDAVKFFAHWVIISMPFYAIYYLLHFNPFHSLPELSHPVGKKFPLILSPERLARLHTRTRFHSSKVMSVA